MGQGIGSDSDREEAERQGRGEGRERAEKQPTDRGEWNEGVKEKRVSACAAQLGLRTIEQEKEGARAKCLMWITVGQTSEEDKTTNMSLCSLLAFSNRCLLSPSPATVARPGWSDPDHGIFLINTLQIWGFLDLKLLWRSSWGGISTSPVSGK